jgi:hypothetical protein
MSVIMPPSQGESDDPCSGQSLSSSATAGFEVDELRIRRTVAANPNTPKQVLARLAQDKTSLVRKHVAENPHTSTEVLKHLASDAEIDVRLAVAENSSVPLEILVCLAADSDPDLRYGVAENHNMPIYILAELARDDNPYIRCRALKTLKTLSPDLLARFNLTRGFFFS